jgi:hypothetical protein
MFAVGPEDQQIPLCLDCQLKLAQISAIQSDRLEREINFITAQAESAVGLHGILPRYPERQVRVIQGGTMTLNNISVSNSALTPAI